MRRLASSAPWAPSSGGMEEGALPLSVRLREALSGGECERVEALLQQGADPNLVLPEGIAGIHLAAGMEKESGIQCLRLILQYGGDPNIRSVDGLTPLHVAAAWGCYSCLKLLLVEGGDPRLKDQDGNTALDLALEEGNEMCVRILQEFLEEAGEGHCRWMGIRREESFLSTITEDSLNPGLPSRLDDTCPIFSGRNLRPAPSKSLQHVELPVFLSRPSESQDETCSFEDRIALSFLTECSLASSTLSGQGDPWAQLPASTCWAGMRGQLAPTASATRGSRFGGPELPKPDLGTTQTHYVQDTTTEGSPLPPGGAFPPSKLRVSLEVQNTNRCQETPRPSPTHAVVSRCEADPVPSKVDPNTTFNLSQYGSFLDPGLVVRATGHEGLDVTSPDHPYLFSREIAAAASDLDKTVVVSAELLPNACGNLGRGLEQNDSFGESSSSGQYASCDSEGFASATEAPRCGDAETKEGRGSTFSCSPYGSHDNKSNSLMSEWSLGLSPRGCSSEKPVEAPIERNSPPGSDCPRHLYDKIGCNGAHPNVPLDLCTCREDEGPGVFQTALLLAKCPLQKRGTQGTTSPPLGEWEKPAISGAEKERLLEMLSPTGGTWESRGKLKGRGSAESQESLGTEERRFHSTCSRGKEGHLWTPEMVLIQKAPEETPSAGMTWDSAETMAIPHQTPPSDREEEPTALEAKLRAMMLATKIVHSPLLQPHQSPRHITPRTKSRLMTSAAHTASSSSSLFDETLEVPQRPRRERNPRGPALASADRQGRSASPRNSSHLPGAAEDLNSELDDTVLIGAGPGSHEPSSGSGSLPVGCSVVSLDTPGSAGRGVESSDTECGSKHVTHSEEELPLNGGKVLSGSREKACAGQESPGGVVSQGNPERLRTRPGRNKRQGNRSRVSFSRLPRASTCPAGRASPVAQDLQLSPGGRPVKLSATEPVEYLYEDEGHTLVERRIPCTDDSFANTTATSDDTVIYDWRAYTGQAAGPADVGGRSPPPASELSRLSDEGLVQRLRDFGVNPGPVTELTRKIYLQLLEKLMSDPKTKSRKGSAGYSPELSTALDTYQIPDGQEDEMALARQFDQPDKSCKWREGLLKSSFNYLLLDPRVTQNLPFRCQYISRAECFRTFVSAIFYVGKGKRSRPYCHLYEALACYHQRQKKRDGQGCSKVQHILEIWACGQGVISMHCFQNVIPVEAYTREACMVDAIGLKMLTNQKKGNYYGVVAGWPMRRRRCLGTHLLHRAMQIFLAEGERQLRPADIRTGQ